MCLGLFWEKKKGFHKREKDLRLNPFPSLPLLAISIPFPLAACTWSPPLYLSLVVSFSSSDVMWSIAPESMY